MGRRNYLIDGVSGSGKTSVATELQRRGHQVVHGDRELQYRGDPSTGMPVAVPKDFPDDLARAEWISAHLCWPVDEVRAVVEDSTAEMTFFCGGSRNTAMFIDGFDNVFVLEVDLDTMIERLDERPGDDWAGRGRDAEREVALRLHRTRRDLPEGVAIDATQPLSAVVDQILRHCEWRRGDSNP